MTKKEQGQYFTANLSLQQKVLDFIKNDPTIILEPSVGKGHLVNHIKIQKTNVNFEMFEIDTSIEPLDGINKNNIIYADFMLQNIDRKYQTIVGNPPFVRTKKGNLYVDFTRKCYELLEHNGELIFIVPSDIFKLTCASKLLNEMMNQGTFTHIYHPHDEKLFEGASIDVVVFRYCKNNEINKQVLYNDTLLHVVNTNGVITFEEESNKNVRICDLFEIYVGIVSGKDDVFKNTEFGNIDVVTGNNKTDKFILIHQYPSGNNDLDQYMLNHKSALLQRKIRKFNEKNWFEWGALRNASTIEKYHGNDCIYIHNLTRKEEPAFIGKIGYFGGNLLMMRPKVDCDLNKVIQHLNSPEFRKNYMFSGRFKIGHRQLSNSLLALITPPQI